MSLQMVYYYKCLRFLFHPILSAQQTHLRFVKKCAEACGGVCQTYKKLHQSIQVGFSLMALHSVFLAGLTLVYCTWLHPQDVFSITTSNDMNACSIVLYIITERWPGAKKYRDTYEAIKQSVLESVEESKYEPRKAIKRPHPDLLPNLDRNEEGSLEVSRMVADMVGEPVSFGTSPIAGMATQLGSDLDMSLMDGEFGNGSVVATDFSMQLNASALDFQQTAFTDDIMGFDDLDGTTVNDLDFGNFDMGQLNSR